MREKILISRQFDMMRNALTSKDKELIKELEENNKHNIQILSTSLEGINENQEEANKIKKAIELTLSKDDVLVLQEYKHISHSDQKLLALNKSNETVTGDLSALNSDFLQQETKAFNEAIITLKLQLEK